MYQYNNPNYPDLQKIKKDTELKKGLNNGLAGTLLLAAAGNVLAIIITMVLGIIANLTLNGSAIEASNYDIQSVISSLFSTDNIYGLIINMLLYIFSMFLPFLLIVIIRRNKIKELMSFKKPKAIHLAYGVFITMGISVFAQMGVSLLLSFLENLGISPNFPDITLNSSSPVSTGLYFFYISILPAFFEEFAMRGVVMGSVKKFSKYFAIFFSALLFSLMHGTIQQIPFAFAIGLSIGYFVMKFDSIWIGIAIHFTNNFISCAFELLNKHFNSDQMNVINYMLTALMLILGILFIVIFSLKETFAIDKEGDTRTFKECLVMMFKRPMFYIALVVYIILTYINGFVV